MRYAVALLVLLAEALLQVSVVSRITLLGVTPQLVLLSVISWSLIRGPAEGMFWGFVGGLLFDLVSGSPLGVSAFAMVLVAAICGLSGRTLFGSNVLFPLSMVFLATGVYVLLCGFVLATLHDPTNWAAVLRQVLLPTATANAVLGLAVYPLAAFVNNHTHGQLRISF
ncbi:MAG TPA: rod shape-determining protein MreD [Chloroflexota bacterium]|nr:rod shape-determining protein MreD [Chloroflexota bacterium]